MNTPTTWIVTMLLAAAFVFTRLTLEGTQRTVVGICLAVAAIAVGFTAFARGKGEKDG
ncbi:hypothetical protein [Actinomadura algeriensis]|uniref:Outer membrane lipoprotein n=1 Tax=Actinomadura algeriensis TaxID=1679523 RepID=A0ABR9JYV1_9ACTN|nr:hypothetical protein [Actinomadura algeriensis]MBE1535746.1 putative outer membrane lipoprotein [Actinomadura algeriensis]